MPSSPVRCVNSRNSTDGLIAPRMCDISKGFLTHVRWQVLPPVRAEISLGHNGRGGSEHGLARQGLINAAHGDVINS